MALVALLTEVGAPAEQVDDIASALLDKCGVKEVEDLKYLKDEDVVQGGIAACHRVPVRKAMEKVKQELGRGARGRALHGNGDRWGGRPPGGPPRGQGNHGPRPRDRSRSPRGDRRPRGGARWRDGSQAPPGGGRPRGDAGRRERAQAPRAARGARRDQRGGGKAERDPDHSRRVCQILRYHGEELTTRRNDGTELVTASAEIAEVARHAGVSAQELVELTKTSKRQDGQPRFSVEDGFIRAIHADPTKPKKRQDPVDPRSGGGRGVGRQERAVVRSPQQAGFEASSRSGVAKYELNAAEELEKTARLLGLTCAEPRKQITSIWARQGTQEERFEDIRDALDLEEVEQVVHGFFHPVASEKPEAAGEIELAEQLGALQLKGIVDTGTGRQFAAKAG